MYDDQKRIRLTSDKVKRAITLSDSEVRVTNSAVVQRHLLVFMTVSKLEY